nr:hypothetical protein [Streptomyces sp. 846.5]
MPPVVRGPRALSADPDLPMGTGEDAPRFAAVVHQAVPEHAAAILGRPGVLRTVPAARGRRTVRLRSG